jgi:hypothetical protein
MRAVLVLALLGFAFLLAGMLRMSRRHGRIDPASKTWLLTGAMLALVSAWLGLR